MAAVAFGERNRLFLGHGRRAGGGEQGGGCGDADETLHNSLPDNDAGPDHAAHGPGQPHTKPVKEMTKPVSLAFRRRRSEEHTSELQSLMRHSYSVFCLKKKSIKNTDNKL